MRDTVDIVTNTLVDNLIEIIRLRKDNRQLRAEVERLRAALEQVEWVETESIGGGFCPWCENVRKYGHAPDCQRQAALGK